MKKRINTNNSRGFYELHIRFSPKNLKKISPALGGLRVISGGLWDPSPIKRECLTRGSAPIFLFKEFSLSCPLRSPIPRRRGHSCGKVHGVVNTADSKSQHSGYCWVKLHDIMDTVEFYSMTS
jgi:hypothetical protein